MSFKSHRKPQRHPFGISLPESLPGQMSYRNCVPEINGENMAVSPYSALSQFLHRPPNYDPGWVYNLLVLDIDKYVTQLDRPKPAAAPIKTLPPKWTAPSSQGDLFK